MKKLPFFALLMPGEALVKIFMFPTLVGLAFLPGSVAGADYCRRRSMVSGFTFLEESKDMNRPAWPRASPFPALSLSFLTNGMVLVLIIRSGNHRAVCLGLTESPPWAWTGCPD